MNNTPREDLAKLPLLEAREYAKSWLQMKKSSSKYNHLVRDLDAAPSSREIQRILWNTFLAGDGLAMQGSAWQKLHKTASF